MDAVSLIESLLDQVIQGALPGPQAGSTPAAKEATPSADVEMPDDPVKDKPSMAGGKRQRLRSRSQSLSPLFCTRWLSSL